MKISKLAADRQLLWKDSMCVCVCKWSFGRPFDYANEHVAVFIFIVVALLVSDSDLENGSMTQLSVNGQQAKKKMIVLHEQTSGARLERKFQPISE